MAKIAQISAKYIIRASIAIEGMVDRPDVIGAIFGQTEGLLGEDLELRELQRSGRIGRIEVNVSTKQGKSVGEIIIPSSLDKSETAIIAAALEIIQRIGPCNAKIIVESIEDIRISKRKYVVDRAKELLKSLMENVLPDSQELSEEVAYSVRVMEATTYGPDKLPAGPNIDDSAEIILVEGRADVINLLKHGFKNSISMNGTNVPKTIIDLCKKKEVLVFVDGDRGGDLIIKQLLEVAEIDSITKAPDGKELEELTKKEIHKALRAKMAVEQYKLELETGTHNSNKDFSSSRRDVKRSSRETTSTSRTDSRDSRANKRYVRSQDRSSQRRETREERPPRRVKPNAKELKTFEKMLEDLIGTRGAYILDKDLNILGKVPVAEMESTVKSLKNGVYAVIFDGEITSVVIDNIEKSSTKFLVGMSGEAKSNRLGILTVDSFE